MGFLGGRWFSLEERVVSLEIDEEKGEFCWDYMSGGGLVGLVCRVVVWVFRVF